MKKVSLLKRMIDKFKTKPKRVSHFPLPSREIKNINDHLEAFDRQKLKLKNQNDTIAKNK